MDHKREDNIQTVSDFSQVNLLKKAIQILVPISVFSLLFSQPSVLTALFHYFDNYFSTSISIKLFSYNSERTYIFLLFNGILALIIKNSGLISKTPVNSSLEDNKKLKNDHEPKLAEADQLSEKKTGEVFNEDVAEVEEHEKRDGILITVKGGENLLLAVEDVNYEDQEQHQIISVEEEEEEVGLLSAEELNRKCDDFIKKMRKVIKIEFHQRIMA